jgi:hypothetical protein
VVNFLTGDPVTAALDIESDIGSNEILELYNELQAVVPADKELEAEKVLLKDLASDDPCMSLVTYFKADLAERLSALFSAHRLQLYEAAIDRKSKRCTIEPPEYDPNRYKIQRWQHVVDVFADHGVYPPDFLKEVVRRYQSVPWPESCLKLLGAIKLVDRHRPHRYHTIDDILAELVEGSLRPADTARLALNATGLGVQGIYLPRCLWLDLAWSVLDGGQRTPDLEADLAKFDTRRNMIFPIAEVMI